MKCISCFTSLEVTDEYFKIVKMKKAKYSFSFSMPMSGSWSTSEEPAHMELPGNVKTFCLDCFNSIAGKEFM